MREFVKYKLKKNVKKILKKIIKKKRIFLIMDNLPAYNKYYKIFLGLILFHTKSFRFHLNIFSRKLTFCFGIVFTLNKFTRKSKREMTIL
jgi:hypothetical protein